MKSSSPFAKVFFLAFLFVMFSFLLNITNEVSFGRGKDTLFQASTIDALLAGAYDGVIEIKEAKKHGNFGHGTLHGIDGELVVLDGHFYQINDAGEVREVLQTETSPFLNLVSFEPERFINDYELRLEGNENDFEGLKASLKETLEDNYFHAIKIKGNFKKITTRSIKKQRTPYPKLSEVVKKQSIFNLEDTRGTMVGFLLPEYIEGINVPGYHFHFISEDLNSGGHVLDFETGRGLEVEIDRLDNFYLRLPAAGSGFAKINLSVDRSKELNRVEKAQ